MIEAAGQRWQRNRKARYDRSAAQTQFDFSGCRRPRTAIGERLSAADVAYLALWLLTHHNDQGQLRRPQAKRWRSIVESTAWNACKCKATADAVGVRDPTSRALDPACDDPRSPPFRLSGVVRSHPAATPHVQPSVSAHPSPSKARGGGAAGGARRRDPGAQRPADGAGCPNY